MLQRGRKSQASKLVVANPIGETFLEPSEVLSEAEAAIWNRITTAMPADWFGKEHVDLLVTYCRTSILVSQLDQLLANFLEQTDIFGCLDPKQLKPINDLRDKNVRQQAALARALRLTKQSLDVRTATRTHTQGAATPRPWET